MYWDWVTNLQVLCFLGNLCLKWFWAFACCRGNTFFIIWSPPSMQYKTYLYILIVFPVSLNNRNSNKKIYFSPICISSCTGSSYLSSWKLFQVGVKRWARSSCASIMLYGTCRYQHKNQSLVLLQPYHSISYLSWRNRFTTKYSNAYIM